MSRNTKITLQLFTALLLIIVGCGLLIAGFVVAPLGVIDTSILTAFGETCTFSGALFGIDYTYRYKIYKAPADSNTSENDNK